MFHKSKLFFMMCFFVLVSCKDTAFKEDTPLFLQQSTGLPNTNLPTNWQLTDLQDPVAPNLFIAEGNIYHLNPSWQVAEISYIYPGRDQGEPALDFQIVTGQGSQYENAGKPVSSQVVQTLLNNINQLHATQATLVGRKWVGDYPSWAVELVGVDGQHLLLYSFSIGNPRSGPWNVLYNGRLYAQYTGDISLALAELFPEEGNPATYSGQEQGTLSFATQAWPPQLREGFWGVLPIAGRFRYQLNTASQSLDGYITQWGDNSELGFIGVHTIDTVEQAELTMEDGTTINCSIQKNLSNGLSGIVWAFSCALPALPVSTSYRYDFQVTFSTYSGEQITTTGELWGAIQAAEYPYIPLPEEIKAILSTHPDAQGLLTGHNLLTTFYQATVTTENPWAGIVAGEALLVGDLSIGDRLMRYTITTPFVVENGVTTLWDLDRATLEEILATIESHALTARVSSADPTAVLNIWYAAQNSLPQAGPQFGGFTPPYYETEIPGCQGIPAQSLPNNRNPLILFHFSNRAFNFKYGGNFQNTWHWEQADFVLVDGKPVVAHFNLLPIQDSHSKLLPVFIPSNLSTGEHRPFEYIRMREIDPLGGAILELFTPGGVTTEERSVYKQIVDVLPGGGINEFGAGFTLLRRAFVVTDKGFIEVVACNS